MKRIIAAALLLTLASSTMAQPNRPWYKDWKNWAMLAGSIAAAGYATHEKHLCRQRVGLDGCPMAGYGEFKAREAIQAGAAIGLASLSIWGHQQGYKEWPIFGAGFAGFLVVQGARNQRTPVPAGGRDADKASKTYSFQIH